MFLILSIPTINYASYNIVNLTSQKLTKYNSYVTNAYNWQMKVAIYRLHEKLLKPGKLTMGTESFAGQICYMLRDGKTYREMEKLAESFGRGELGNSSGNA